MIYFTWSSATTYGNINEGFREEKLSSLSSLSVTKDFMQFKAEALLKSRILKCPSSIEWDFISVVFRVTKLKSISKICK